MSPRDTWRIPPSTIKCAPCFAIWTDSLETHNQMLSSPFASLCRLGKPIGAYWFQTHLPSLLPTPLTSGLHVRLLEESVLVMRPFCSPPPVMVLAGCQALHQHSHHPSALKFAKYFCLHYLIQVSYNPLKLGDAYYPLSVSTQEWRPKKANILRTIELVCDKVRILRLTLNPAVFLVQESASSSITL